MTSLAYSPSGTLLALGDQDAYLGIWDTHSGIRTANLFEAAIIDSVAFAPNGMTVAAGDQNGDVILRDVGERKQQRVLHQGGLKLSEGGIVLSVVFSPNGRIIAAGDEAGDVGLWDAQTGKRIATLHEGSAVTGLALSLDGQTTAVGDESGQLTLWSAAGRMRIATISEGSPVDQVAFSRDGQLAVSRIDGNVQLLARSIYPPDRKLASIRASRRTIARPRSNHLSRQRGPPIAAANRRTRVDWAQIGTNRCPAANRRSC